MAWCIIKIYQGRQGGKDSCRRWWVPTLNESLCLWCISAYVKWVSKTIWGSVVESSYPNCFAGFYLWFGVMWGYLRSHTPNSIKGHYKWWCYNGMWWFKTVVWGKTFTEDSEWKLMLTWKIFIQLIDQAVLMYAVKSQELVIPVKLRCLGCTQYTTVGHFINTRF